MLFDPPESWKKVRLEDVCERITVGHVGSMADKYVDDGVPFLRSQNITPFKIDLDSVKYIDEDFNYKLRKSSLQPGDVAIVRTGYPGTAAVIPPSLPVSNCADLVVITPSQDLDSWFLSCLFNSIWGKGAVAGNLVGVAQQHFNVSAAKNLTIHLPPMATQRRITSILSAYDDLIENNSRRIEILEEMARRLYEEWFVHFRFPGHQKIEFKESELGMIPEGWEVAQVSDFGSVVTGKTPSKKKPELFGSDIPFIKTPDMHGNIFCISTNEGLSAEGARSQAKKTVPENSICVSCIGTAGVVTIAGQESQTNQQINTLILHSIQYREFLFFALRGLKETINLYGSNGATMVNLNKGKFESLKIVRPNSTLIEQYHCITSVSFDLIKNLQSKNANLRAQRDLLLPKLVSGEIDVSDFPMPDDKEIEAA